MNHKVTIFTRDWDDLVKPKCACRHESLKWITRGDAQEWEFHHLQQVERAKAALSNREPSMKNQRDHYRRMELDPETSEHDRNLWRIMREELDHRLNDQHPVEQEPLFEIEEKTRAKSSKSGKAVGH
jgi:hypothetical protein